MARDGLGLGQKYRFSGGCRAAGFLNNYSLSCNIGVMYCIIVSPPKLYSAAISCYFSQWYRHLQQVKSVCKRENSKSKWYIVWVLIIFLFTMIVWIRYCFHSWFTVFLLFYIGFLHILFFFSLDSSILIFWERIYACYGPGLHLYSLQFSAAQLQMWEIY